METPRRAWSNWVRASLFSLLLLLLPPPSAASVDSIRELIRAGRFTEAVAQCDAELRAAPASAPLWTLRGLALRGAGDNAGAVLAWRRAGDYPPALQALAQVQFDARDPAARATLERLLRLLPDAAPARAMLATLHYEARDCAGVTRQLTAAELPPAARWQLGVCQYELGRYADAIAQFTALLRLREHAPTRFNLALAQWQLRDYRAAAATLAGAHDADALRLLAGAQTGLGDVPAALATLQTGVNRFPADIRFVLDLAALCLDHGNAILGLEVVEAGLSQHGETAELATLRGVLLVRSGDTAKGEAALREAEQRWPLGRVGLASLLMQAGSPAEAARLLHAIAHATPPDDRALVTYTRAVLQKGPTSAEAAGVLKLLRSAIARDPRNAAAQSLLGKLLANAAPREAINALRAALAVDPADRASLFQLMTLLRRQGSSAEAAELAKRLQALGDAERQAEAGRFRLVRTDP
jgi:tetratricopeptide (TPR) repeat protein